VDTELSARVRDITFLELEAFVEIGRLRSLRAVARLKGLQPSHVSKILNRLQRKLSIPLFRTSPSGVVLTREGIQLVETADKILREAESFRAERPGTVKPAPRSVLTIGAVSFLQRFLLPPCMDALGALAPQARFRLLELQPDQLVAAGLRGAMDLTVHVGVLPWTKRWSSLPLGVLSWALVARPDHALAAGATQAQVLAHPFVTPTYWTNEGFFVGNDYCPLPWDERIKGHEVSSAEGAVQMVLHTGQLAFIPRLTVASHLASGRLVEVRVKGWKRVERPVFLSVKSDAVAARLQRSVAAILSRSLS
jgi:DNA-binding transcriptional LysR family regulator